MKNLVFVIVIVLFASCTQVSKEESEAAKVFAQTIDASTKEINVEVDSIFAICIARIGNPFTSSEQEEKKVKARFDKLKLKVRDCTLQIKSLQELDSNILFRNVSLEYIIAYENLVDKELHDLIDAVYADLSLDYQAHVDDLCIATWRKLIRENQKWIKRKKVFYKKYSIDFDDTDKRIITVYKKQMKFYQFKMEQLKRVLEM